MHLPSPAIRLLLIAVLVSARAIPAQDTIRPAATQTVVPARAAVLRASPAGKPTARVDTTARLEVLARDRNWLRVRTEGWVLATDVLPADSGELTRMSAADLRADSAGSRGKLVRWAVEFVALHTADPLRKGLVDGEPYILAQGPGEERSLLYIAVPPSLLGMARAIPPLAQLTIVARVRFGRSDPVGVPVLDLQALSRIQ
ncbi:MAG: hypothetical protein NUW01_04185 [Gemmatimonadaceae bacterium]|nr:hypothetical protein [Gemmatimonadaceae bacterium]